MDALESSAVLQLANACQAIAFGPMPPAQRFVALARLKDVLRTLDLGTSDALAQRIARLIVVDTLLRVPATAELPLTMDWAHRVSGITSSRGSLMVTVGPLAVDWLLAPVDSESTDTV